MAARLGVPETTLAQWETGALIQPQALDNLLRVFFAFPVVRAALTGPGQDPALGPTVRDGGP